MNVQKEIANLEARISELRKLVSDSPSPMECSGGLSVETTWFPETWNNVDDPWDVSEALGSHINNWKASSYCGRTFMFSICRFGWDKKNAFDIVEHICGSCPSFTPKYGDYEGCRIPTLVSCDDSVQYSAPLETHGDLHVHQQHGEEGDLRR